MEKKEGDRHNTLSTAKRSANPHSRRLASQRPALPTSLELVSAVAAGSLLPSFNHPPLPKCDFRLHQLTFLFSLSLSFSLSAFLACSRRLLFLSSLILTSRPPSHLDSHSSFSYLFSCMQLFGICQSTLSIPIISTHNIHATTTYLPCCHPAPLAHQYSLSTSICSTTCDLSLDNLHCYRSTRDFGSSVYFRSNCQRTIAATAAQHDEHISTKTGSNAMSDADVPPSSSLDPVSADGAGVGQKKM